ncbi:hypothetical protein OG782_21220 [Streptomyces sp. NBC_00876]|uniref:hypothetical protein n=1 Tax=Streptomyces sp. NBC_00876 TaxID=2975853 RepID=UPI003868B48D|nr:hypothetical protein OG782_21220 [Streptomyces sp. NBC_00876]
MTTWFDELPEVLTRADFGALVGRPPRSIELMGYRGLVADPAYRNRNKLVWDEETAIGWFRSLHNHAVIVPANEQAMLDLAAHRAYICPLDSKHVALARPRILVMYQRGGAGTVFGVDAVETINQEIDGTRSASPQTRQILRDGEPLDRYAHRWTVFHLSEAGAIGTITPAIQQGRYLRVDDVLDALTSGHLSVPTLDEAFPSRK